MRSFKSVMFAAANAGVVLFGIALYLAGHALIVVLATSVASLVALNLIVQFAFLLKGMNYRVDANAERGRVLSERIQVRVLFPAIGIVCGVFVIALAMTDGLNTNVSNLAFGGFIVLACGYLLLKAARKRKPSREGTDGTGAP